MEAIVHLRLRGVLESRGAVTVEAELGLDGGAVGVGSAPVAIAPGRRERPRSTVPHLGPLDADPTLAAVRTALVGGRWDDQAAFDAELEAVATRAGVGANVTLAVSLAFCRASAVHAGHALHRHLAGDTAAARSMPHPLVNLFSGGIHGETGAVPFQQIMLTVETGSFRDDVALAAAIYTSLEAGLARRGRAVRHSASSGIVVEGMDHAALLDEVAVEIARYSSRRAQLGIGIDVAAEHLRGPDGRYAFAGRQLGAKELTAILVALTRRYPVRYLEDPFDAEDVDAWRDLVAELKGPTLVFGDDAFATSEEYLDGALAHGMVLKMSQVGTVTGALRAARKARALALALCVSHRSGETEDTAMCDVAVTVGAEFVKIGGPRRGDRVAKYNRLLRLAEEIETA